MISIILPATNPYQAVKNMSGSHFTLKSKENNNKNLKTFTLTVSHKNGN